jgi:hypothetical protein
MALGGPLQGQLTGVSTFINSGIIDLQQNPAAGDVLVITGASPFTGASGGGTYISPLLTISTKSTMSACQRGKKRKLPSRARRLPAQASRRLSRFTAPDGDILTMASSKE